MTKDFWSDQFRLALEKNVEENSRQSEWPVYEDYEVKLDKAGNRYFRAPESSPVKKRLQPLTRVSADLFLRFAHWVEDPGMDRGFDTERNATAHKMWAENFGVLGLDPPDQSDFRLPNSTRVMAEYLGRPWLPQKPRGWRNTARGGRRESVDNFAFEAWEAHMVLRLYQSVRSQEVVDAPSAIRFMSPDDQVDLPISGRPPHVEKDFYSEDPELTRMWALGIVNDAVNRKIESHCYPIIQGAPSSHQQAWGSRSLLGAMWLQMMFLMLADRYCWWCGKGLDPGRHSHARFCDNDGRCRAKWNYHEGEGRSSKEKRRQSRYVR